ncbi:unnamed protein product [Caenorhabditis nigoni]
MPELVIENIIGFLDFRYVLTLRQVCRDFRNFIDRLNDSKLPDSRFTKIAMIVNKDIRFIYEDSYRNRHEFVYSESNNSRSFNRKRTNLGNSNLVDVAIRDLEQVLKFEKSTLKWSSFDFVDRLLSNHSLFSSLLIILSNMFQKLNRKIKTESLGYVTNLFLTVIFFKLGRTRFRNYFEPR